MKAIILAAGRGSRMRERTDEHPKCLTIVKGKPLIEHQIDALTQAGIRDIAIVTGYKAESLKTYGSYQFHNPRWFETNMVASLLCAKDWLGKTDCIISYSDLYYESDIVKKLISCDHEVVVSFDPNWYGIWSKRFENVLDDAETFLSNEEGVLLDIGRKTTDIDEVKGQYIGLLKFKKEFWTKPYVIENDKMDMTSFLRYLIKQRQRIDTVPNESLWFEFDKPEDIEAFYT